MQISRQRILTLLKANHRLVASELSEMLDISTTAVRRHLQVLESRNLILHRVEQRGLGRPSFVYELVDSCLKEFPSDYMTIVRSTSDLIKSEKGTDLDGLLAHHQDKRRQYYIAQVKGEVLSERVASLSRLLEREGRLTSWQRLDVDHYILREHNCPFCHLVDKFDHLCCQELALLNEVLEAKVERIDHMRRGGISCVYQIRQDNGNDIGLKTA